MSWTEHELGGRPLFVWAPADRSATYPTVYVLHVGRIERPLQPPKWPWEVGLVAFEVARRHRFVDDLSKAPEGVRVHVLPSGDEGTPLAKLRYRDSRSVKARIARAYEATAGYLKDPVSESAG